MLSPIEKMKRYNFHFSLHANRIVIKTGTAMMRLVLRKGAIINRILKLLTINILVAIPKKRSPKEAGIGSKG
jgi:hypothetical protein